MKGIGKSRLGWVSNLLWHCLDLDFINLDMLQTIQREGKKRAGWKMQGGKNVVCYKRISGNSKGQIHIFV